MLLHRLSGRKRCDRVRTKGVLWKGKHFFVRWIPGTPMKGDPEGIYIGLVASTKLHKSAVKRNRMRRRCREAFRITLKTIDISRSPLTAHRSVQLLLFPKSSSLLSDFREILTDVTHFLAILPHAR